MKKLWVMPVAAFLWGVAFAQSVERLDGFGGYRFGMTLQEADKVRADDKVTDCEYPSVYKCLTYNTEFYGQKAEVNAQIDSETRRIKQIVVTFSRLDPGPPGQCRAVYFAVIPQLVKVYGTKYTETKTGGQWHFPKGGEVELVNSCLSDDEGLVVVSYRQTEGL